MASDLLTGEENENEKDRLGVKPIDEAYEVTSNAWFPANPVVLRTIRTRWSSKEYSSDRDKLIDDLRRDFSLFLFTVKNLRELVGSKDTESSNTIADRAQSFAQIIRDASDEELDKIFSSNADQISTHSIEDISRAQATRVRETAISTSTSEAIAENFDIEPEQGLTCALLRQLGLTLISWNYPEAYSELLGEFAASHKPSDNELDNLFRNALGFSPAMLGAAFAEKWSLSHDLVDAVNTNSSTEEITSAVSKQSTTQAPQKRKLSQICSVGEAFARANNPQQYPTAIADWEMAEEVITNILGEDGMSAVSKKAQSFDLYQANTGLANLETTTADTSNGSSEGLSDYANQRRKRNLYLKALPDEIRVKIEKIYSKMEDKFGNDTLLRELIHETFVEIGFNVCSIHMLDPVTGTISPVLKRGTPAFIPMKAVGLLDANPKVCPIIRAFQSNAPIAEVGFKKDERKLFLVGAIGNNKPIGVLYLELGESALIEVADPSLVFRTLQQCLSDVLHL